MRRWASTKIEFTGVAILMRLLVSKSQWSETYIYMDSVADAGCVFWAQITILS